MVSETIKNQVKIALKKLLGHAWTAEVHLEHPAVEDHGDYSTNIAMAMFRQLKTSPKIKPRQLDQIKSPKILADTIVDLLNKDNHLHKLVAKITVAGPGFINFWLKDEILISEIEKVTKLEQNYGQSDLGRGRKAVVEYSSPNIAKPFTVGHLRSTIIGQAIGNLLEFTGWIVYRDNHLGDWGTQFGKQIYAIKQWGDENQIEKSTNPVKELVGLYVKFHQEADKEPSLEDEGRRWFKKLEDGYPEAKRLWQKCIDWSWKEFDRIYQILGVEFTENDGRGYGESFFEDKMPVVITELEAKGLLKDSEGARLVFFPNDELPPLMIIKKDGTTLYATRDLATDKFRLDRYGQDVVIINEVGAEQSLYFQQLFKVEEMLGWVQPGQRVHVKHGHFRFKDKKMSTRKGEVVWLDDVITVAIEKAFIIRMTAPIEEKHVAGIETQKIDIDVAIGALKWNDLKRDSKIDVVFDWDEMLRMQGNSGPYLQYTYARCRSVLAKAKTTNYQLSTINYQLNAQEASVLRYLYRLPEVVLQAAQEYAPNHICTYLYNFAQRYNTFYNQDSILQADTEGQKQFRLLLTVAVGQVLQNGLHLLGIEAPEKM